MPETGRRGRVEAFLRALSEQDFERIRTLVHDDYVEEYPQSGERVRGVASQLRDPAQLPRRRPPPGAIDVGTAPIVGEEDAWVVGPSLAVVHVSGTGDQYTGVMRIRYPDGSTWHVVAILEFRGDRIARNTRVLRPGLRGARLAGRLGASATSRSDRGAVASDDEAAVESGPCRSS